MKNKISIDEAIETVDRFVKSQEKDQVPALEDFELQNGAFQVKELSKLEATLQYLMESVSKEKRLEKRRSKKKMEAHLLQSVDTIQIALVKLAHSKEHNQELEEKLHTLAHRYNRVVRQAQTEPKEPLQKLKYHIYKGAGWLFDDDLLKREIQLPQKKNPRKYRPASPTATSQKVATLLPLRQEIDLFFAKAHTLLRQQKLPTSILEEALKSIRSQSIEATTKAEAIVSMQLPLSLLPGEVLLMQGAFSRKEAISVPIKESFKIIAKATQTGFPHPLQSIGFAFSELLLPTFLLRPHLAPKIERLLKKKEEIAEALMPNGHLNEKAKAQLSIRKELFQAHHHLFEPLQKHFLKACSMTHTEFQEEVERAINRPLRDLQEKWIQGSIKTKRDVEDHFPPASSLLMQAASAIGTLLYSEKVGYKPELLDPFSKKILASVLRELADFIHELEEIPAEKKEMLAWMTTLHERRSKLFSTKTVSDTLVDELEGYYVLRSF